MLLFILIFSIIIATVITSLINKLITKKEKKEFEESTSDTFHILQEYTPEELQKLEYQELKNISIQLHDINKNLFNQNKTLNTISNDICIILVLILIPIILKIITLITGINVLSDLL